MGKKISRCIASSPNDKLRLVQILGMGGKPVRSYKFNEYIRSEHKYDGSITPNSLPASKGPTLVRVL